MKNNFREMVKPVNLHLSTLENEMRRHLRDGEVKLSQSESQGRVVLEISEESLSSLLGQLQVKNEDKWSREKARMQQEICLLKSLLEEAYNKQRSCISDLKYQLRKIRIQKAHNPEQEGDNTKDLQLQLEVMQAEKEALEKEVEAVKLEVSAEKQLRQVAEKHPEASADGLKVQLFEARTQAEELEKALQSERTQTEKLQKRLCETEEALQKQEKEVKRSTERAQASQEETRKVTAALKDTQDKLEAERLEKNTLMAELKGAEDEMTRVRLQWQKEKNTLLQETEETRLRLVAQLESDRAEWQEARSSLLQATEDVKDTLARKEQEWETKESSLRARVEELERKIAKKKKKWYRRILRFVAPGSSAQQ